MYHYYSETVLKIGPGYSEVFALLGKPLKVKRGNGIIGL